MRVALVITLLLMAGCFGQGDGPEPTTPDPQPQPTPTPTPQPPPASQRVVLLDNFGFQDCAGIEAWFSVPADQAQAVLPDNFTAATGDAPQGRVADARYRIFSCPSFTASAATINDTVYGDVAIRIDDPGIESSGDLHWYRFRIFSADDNLAAAWEVAGYEVVTGTATFSPGPPLRDWSFAGYSSDHQPVSAATLAERQISFTETDAGLVVWSESMNDATTHEQAIGTFTVPGDDPLANMLPADPLSLGLWEHTQTSVMDATAVLLQS